jgi:hypothetical protein
MLKFNAWELALVLQKINDAKAYAVNRCEAGNRDDEVPESGIKTLVIPLVLLLRELAEQTELHSTLDRVANGSGYFDQAVLKALTFQELRHQLTVLREAIEADLEKRHFVFIPSEKAKLLTEMPASWEQVWKKLPSCRKDSEEAVYSYCLGRNTASVFHSMRVSEHGLRNVAKKIGVTLTHGGKPQPIEFATWGKVIAEIKNKINVANLLPHGPRRNRQLQFYSNAADSCTFIRDIWRNEVSHARKTYSEAEALKVMSRVRDFMQFLVDPPR